MNSHYRPGGHEKTRELPQRFRASRTSRRLPPLLALLLLGTVVQLGPQATAMGPTAATADVATGPLALASASTAGTTCADKYWVGGWEAPPSDSGQDPFWPTSYVDLQGNLRPHFLNNTVRAVLAPTTSGQKLRLRFTNRFGSEPVVFGSVTIAKQLKGAAVDPATLRRITFNAGKRSVTIPAGRDILSDPVRFSFQAMQNLAVSIHVPGNVPFPTVHGTARQYSYLTLPLTGDATAKTSGGSFLTRTATRPFVSGLEVVKPRKWGAVVAIGDSLTDGARPTSNGAIENPADFGRNVRYTDWLARRFKAAGKPLTVLNAGLSGNRLLRDGQPGGSAGYGKSLLNRLETDALQQRGVGTVIVWIGINDVVQTPVSSAAEVIAGYKELFARLDRAGVRTVQATLSPFKGFIPAIATTAQAEIARQQVNAWIRANSPADAVLDIDKLLRDPARPDRLDPRWDGGDHLHLSPAGNKRIASAFSLRQFATPHC